MLSQITKITNTTQLNTTQLNSTQFNSCDNKGTKKIVPPTLDEIKAYCLERKNNVDPERFFDYYSANGWVQGKGKPIKDWKACVRTWEQNTVATNQNNERKENPYAEFTGTVI